MSASTPDEPVRDPEMPPDAPRPSPVTAPTPDASGPSPPIPPGAPGPSRVTATPDAWSDEAEKERLGKAWEAAREIIRNENDLINHRLTALLTLQGFLFTGVVFGSQGLAKPDQDYRWAIALFLTVVAYVGFVVPRLIAPVVSSANRHVNATREWWYEYRRNKAYRDVCPFPGIVGNLARSLNPYLPTRGWQTEDDDGERCAPEDRYIGQLGFDDPLFDDARRDELRERIHGVRQGAPRLIRLLEDVWKVFLVTFFIVFVSLLPGIRWGFGDRAAKADPSAAVPDQRVSVPLTVDVLVRPTVKTAAGPPNGASPSPPPVPGPARSPQPGVK